MCIISLVFFHLLISHSSPFGFLSHSMIIKRLFVVAVCLYVCFTERDRRQFYQWISRFLICKHTDCIVCWLCHGCVCVCPCPCYLLCTKAPLLSHSLSRSVFLALNISHSLFYSTSLLIGFAVFCHSFTWDNDCHSDFNCHPRVHITLSKRFIFILKFIFPEITIFVYWI